MAGTLQKKKAVKNKSYSSDLLIVVSKTIKPFAKGKNDSHIHRDKMTNSELIEGKVPSHDDSWKNVFSFEKSY